MECLSDVWIDHFNKLGLPVALLVMMFYSTYRAIRWLAPKLDTWVNNYLAIQEQRSKLFQESTEKFLVSQNKILITLDDLVNLINSKEKGN